MGVDGWEAHGIFLKERAFLVFNVVLERCITLGSEFILYLQFTLEFTNWRFSAFSGGPFVSGFCLGFFVTYVGVLPSLSSLNITFENPRLLIYRRSSSILLLAVHPDAYIYTKF